MLPFQNFYRTPQPPRAFCHVQVLYLLPVPRPSPTSLLARELVLAQNGKTVEAPTLPAPPALRSRTFPAKKDYFLPVYMKEIMLTHRNTRYYM